jgi:ribose 5-phosphate isomerase A
VAAVEDGMVIGLGSGSTSMKALHVLARRMREEGLRVRGVPTSVATEREACSLGIPLTTLDEDPKLDLAIDGADQVDAKLAAIKGRGGALLREKVVASCAERLLIMVDPSKLCDVLDIAVPIEVLPFALAVVRRKFEEMGGRADLRATSGGEPYVTDNGNSILDVGFGRILDPAALAERLSTIPGVVEHGLFVGMVTEVHVGEKDSARIVRRPR